MTEFIFIFSALLICSSVAVLFSRSNVFSVLWLASAFLCGSGILMTIGSEFMAMIFIIVYVGAVVILFLFVVMMLDLRKDTLTYYRNKNLIAFLLVSGVFASSITFGFYLNKDFIYNKNLSVIISGKTTPTQVGKVLYTSYIYPFQMSGFLLLLAMISAVTISSTFDDNKKEEKEKTLQQDVDSQLSAPSKAELKKVNFRTGIRL